MGHFLPFQSPDNPEYQNFKIEKNTWRYYHFTHLHHKWQSYDAWFLRYVTQQNFLSFWTVFCPFTPPWTQKSKFWKNEEKKKTPEDIIVLQNVYHKWQPYDVWFLRYGMQKTGFLVILDCFLPFYPSNNPKNQNFEKWKKHLEILPFYTCVP